MITLDYTDAHIFGGLPTTTDFATCDEYMYACGLLPPRHPVPAIPDNHEYLARRLGAMSGAEWFRLWEWSHMEWFITTL